MVMTSKETSVSKRCFGALVLLAAGAAVACSGDDDSSSADEVAQTDDTTADGTDTSDGTASDDDVAPPAAGTMPAEEEGEGADGEQLPMDPASAGSSEDPVGELPPFGGLPPDPGGNPAAGGTGLNLNELLQTPECNTGWLSDDPETEADCAATFRANVCFKTEEEACTCAGCGSEECALTDSIPSIASCNTGPGLGGECAFVWFDICYATAEEACEAAGCPDDGCLIAESFPAQVSCQ